MTKARNLSKLMSDNIVGTTELADNAVTTAKLANDAVTAAKLDIDGGDISYDNSVSGISATTLQAAIDYLNVLSGGGSAGAQATYTREEFTATAGQTTFTTVNGYTLGYLQVFMNGIMLDSGDYTANDESTVVLATGAAANDEVTTIAYDSFAISEVLRVLNISASASNNALTLAASGNVGIGTSSPDSLQTLQDDSNTLGPILTFKNQYRSGSTTADYMGGMAFSCWRDISPSKSYVAGIYGLNDYYPGTSGHLVFTTGTNGGTDPYNAGSERMRIDNAGRVTTPYQPAWFATGSVGWHTTSTGGVVPLAAVPLNRGNHYNTSGSKFTAPVTGVYQVNIIVYMETTGQLCLKVNGADYIPTGGDTAFITFTNNNTSNEVSATSGTIPLSAGDYIQLGARNSQAAYLYTGHTSFSGYLIG